MWSIWRLKNPKPAFTTVQVVHLVLKALPQMHLRQLPLARSYPNRCTYLKPPALSMQTTTSFVIINTVLCKNTAVFQISADDLCPKQATSAHYCSPELHRYRMRNYRRASCIWTLDQERQDLFSVHSSALELLCDRIISLSYASASSAFLSKVYLS